MTAVHLIAGCPFCRARRGERCRATTILLDGKRVEQPIVWTHVERVRAAES